MIFIRSGASWCSAATGRQLSVVSFHLNSAADTSVALLITQQTQFHKAAMLVRTSMLESSLNIKQFHKNTAALQITRTII